MGRLVPSEFQELVKENSLGLLVSQQQNLS